MKNRFNRRHRLPLGEHESSAWWRDRARRASSWPALRAAVSHHPRAAAKACARCCTAPHQVTSRKRDPRRGSSTISAPTYPSLTRHGRFVRDAPHRGQLYAVTTATLQS
ncbi:hypothetical protein OH687_00445 [Burkholderia anthina]|nr:hypothetical protein OH687_00445 [Burkholderia anthina]